MDVGFDCLNPVQTSAAGMDSEMLKAKYRQRLTFWGGGIDTQRVLPFGTPSEVRAMSPHGWPSSVRAGFCLHPVHNVQAGVPTENMLALYEAINEYRDYSVAKWPVGCMKIPPSCATGP